jgi:hypothetical protein
MGRRTAVEERRENPVLHATMQQSAIVYDQIPLKDFIDDRRQSELAREIYLDITRICSSRDPVSACRDYYASTMLKLAAYQVIVIPPVPEEDPSGLRGHPGVTGGLKTHLVELFGKVDNLRSQTFSDTDAGNARDLWKLVQRLYWETYWFLETLHVARIELGDSKPDNDWHRAFLHAACAHCEHVYRWELELPSAFEEAVAKESATAYSVFADIVLSGANDPANEWRDYYRNSGIPMPDFQ